MISIVNLTKAFEQQVLFENLNLEIDDGEFVIFSGVSGCGKTTLLNMIGAIEKIDAGHILVDGIDITKHKNQLNYFRHKVGFLFQNFALVDHKTVLENLKMVRNDCLSSVSITQAMERVGLMDKLNQKVYQLSGGEQQRVALARLMIKKCDLILADEPTGSLDQKNAEQVISILQSLHATGKTIIMVTHDIKYKKAGTRILELPLIQP